MTSGQTAATQAVAWLLQHRLKPSSSWAPTPETPCAAFWNEFELDIQGQPVVVENKPGAGGTLPAQQLQITAADGYTVAQISLGVFRLPYTTKRWR